ncbi:MAG: amino acid permease [Commensalibacter sp.]|nr:amino acid permease [Commensalibacter sp.]
MSVHSKRKSIDQITEESKHHGLERCLGPWRLTMLGIGSVIGAGIFVMTGTAAANFAGPAVILSFIIASIACLFTALAYGELASTIPVAGSAYSYAYTSLGEGFAWGVGWLLLLEYGISAASVASGFSSYTVSLLHDFGLHVPDFIHNPMFQAAEGGYDMGIIFHYRLDIIGALSIFVASFLLLFGVSESTTFNAIIVGLKLFILLLFIGIGVFFIKKSNLTPFIPPSQNLLHFGVPGVFRAASTIFFAYIGFEAVSTAASEARNPQRDVPFGIIASLIICTLIYIGVSLVLVGIVPYQKLNVSDPLALAVDAMGQPWLAWIFKISAVIGLCSVVLVLLYGQTRIFFIMAKDGLLPPLFGRLHPRYRTPWSCTIVLGIFVSAATAILPIDIISDLVSLGTSLAFAVVCFTVILQRKAHTKIKSPIKVTFCWFFIKSIWFCDIPLLGIICCCGMTIPLLVDTFRSLFNHNPIPAILLCCYSALGFLGYYAYGCHHSTLKKTINTQSKE